MTNPITTLADLSQLVIEDWRPSTPKRYSIHLTLHGKNWRVVNAGTHHHIGAEYPGGPEIRVEFTDEVFAELIARATHDRSGT